jgi:transporter family protein
VSIPQRSQLLAVAFALISSLAWGFWGYYSHQASRTHAAMGLWVTSVLIEGLIVLPFTLRVRPVWSWSILGVAVFGVVGYGIFFLALKVGRNPAPLVAITALYPVVTLVLEYLLQGASVSPRQLVGIALAVVAVVVLAL